MKAKTIKYARTSSKNYQSQSVGIEIELEKGDTAAKTLAVARAWVNTQLEGAPSKQEVEKAKATLAKAEQLEFVNL